MFQQFKMNLVVRYYKPFSRLPKQCRCIFTSSIGRQKLHEKDVLVKPFEEIPKSKAFPIIGSFLDNLAMKRGTGTQLDLFKRRIKKYGPVFREESPFTEEAVFTINPEDFEKVFKDEEVGKFTERTRFWTYNTYGRKHGTPNPLFDMGADEFFRRKAAIQNAIMSPKEVAKLTSLYSKATYDFMEYLEKQKEPGKDDIHDIRQHIFWWVFECAGITLFGERLGCLDNNEIQETSVKKLAKGFENFMPTFMDLETLFSKEKSTDTHLWKQYEQKLNLQYEGMAELMERYEEKVIDQNSDLSDIEKVTACLDILRASLDTTTETATYALFEISKCPEVQEKICQEVRNNIGGDDTIFDNKQLQKLPYTRACLKENNRLHPLLPSLSRKTKSDLVLSGYEVPSGTIVTMLLAFTNQSDEIEDSHEFKPERWMRTQGQSCPVKRKPHPFAVVPFGHGIRGCMGRRLAESELYCLFATLFKKYDLHCYNKKFTITSKIITTINEPLTFRLRKRQATQYLS